MEFYNATFDDASSVQNEFVDSVDQDKPRHALMNYLEPTCSQSDTLSIMLESPLKGTPALTTSANSTPSHQDPATPFVNATNADILCINNPSNNNLQGQLFGTLGSAQRKHPVVNPVGNFNTSINKKVERLFNGYEASENASEVYYELSTMSDTNSATTNAAQANFDLNDTCKTNYETYAKNKSYQSNQFGPTNASTNQDLGKELLFSTPSYSSPSARRPFDFSSQNSTLLHPHNIAQPIESYPQNNPWEQATVSQATASQATASQATSDSHSAAVDIQAQASTSMHTGDNAHVNDLLCQIIPWVLDVIFPGNSISPLAAFAVIYQALTSLRTHGNTDFDNSHNQNSPLEQDTTFQRNNVSHSVTPAAPSQASTHMYVDYNDCFESFLNQNKPWEQDFTFHGNNASQSNAPTVPSQAPSFMYTGHNTHFNISQNQTYLPRQVALIPEITVNSQPHNSSLLHTRDNAQHAGSYSQNHLLRQPPVTQNMTVPYTTTVDILSQSSFSLPVYNNTNLINSYVQNQHREQVAAFSDMTAPQPVTINVPSVNPASLLKHDIANYANASHKSTGKKPETAVMSNTTISRKTTHIPPPHTNRAQPAKTGKVRKPAKTALLLDGNKYSKCPECENIITKKNLNAHRALHDANKTRFTCDFEGCNKSYSRQSDLINRHILPFHQGQIKSCPNCHQTFCRPDRLKKHKANCHSFS